MAKSATGGRLSDCVCGLLGRQCAREPTRDEQGPLPGAGGELGRTEGAAGHVDGPNGGSQVLALGAHRIAEPWGERYLHCVCGWTQRSTRSDRDGLSTDTGAIVHGTSDAQLAALRLA